MQAPGRGRQPSPRLYGYLGYPAQQSYSAPRFHYKRLLHLWQERRAKWAVFALIEISGSVMGLQNPSHCFSYSWQGKHGLSLTSQSGQFMRNLLRINDLEERNVKTSKYLALGLGALLTLSLVSCGGQQAQEPQQEVQQSEPVTTESKAEPMEVKQEVNTTGTTSEPVEGEQDTENEVDPAGTVGEAEPVVELFTEVNETVYATGTVNIRSSWSAESEKLGSLNKGDSVTRTGISIEGTEAEGWSRIQLSNGDTVYVSNKYLSTTKPTTQSTNNGGSSTQSKPTGGQQQQQQTQQQPTGDTQQQQPTGGSTSSQKVDGHDDLGDYVLNGKGGKYYPALGITLPVSYDGTTHGGKDFSQSPDYNIGETQTAEQHTEAWRGVNGG